MDYTKVYDPSGRSFEIPSPRRVMELVRDNGWSLSPKAHPAPSAAPAAAPAPVIAPPAEPETAHADTVSPPAH